MESASKNDISIRLPDERWEHIIEQHPEMAEYRDEVMLVIGDPYCILQGNQGELLAIREVQPDKWLVAAYRESGEDGFVITAFLTRRRNWWDRKEQVWP